MRTPQWFCFALVRPFFGEKTDVGVFTMLALWLMYLGVQYWFCQGYGGNHGGGYGQGGGYGGRGGGYGQVL